MAPEQESDLISVINAPIFVNAISCCWPVMCATLLGSCLFKLLHNVLAQKMRADASEDCRADNVDAELFFSHGDAELIV